MTQSDFYIGIGIGCVVAIGLTVWLGRLLQRTGTSISPKRGSDFGISQGYGDPPVCLACLAHLAEEEHAEECPNINIPVAPFDVAAYNARWTCAECGLVARYPDQHDDFFNPCSQYQPFEKKLEVRAWG